MSSLKYYEPSSTTPIINKITFIILVFIIVGITSIAYGAFCAHNMVIYFSFAAMIIYGTTMAFIYRIISKLCKIRSIKFKKISSILVGVIGLHLSWFAYSIFLLIGEEPLLNFAWNNIDLYYNLGNLFSFISYLTEVGVLGYGPLLSIIWMLEALIIVFIPSYILLKQNIAPFSYFLNQWYSKYILNKDFETLINIEEFLNEPDKLAYLKKMKNGSIARYARISVFYLEREEKQYLQIEHVLRDTRGNGESSTIKVNNLEIPTHLARELLNEFHGKKSFFFDY